MERLIFTGEQKGDISLPNNDIYEVPLKGMTIPINLEATEIIDGREGYAMMGIREHNNFSMNIRDYRNPERGKYELVLTFDITDYGQQRVDRIGKIDGETITDAQRQHMQNDMESNGIQEILSGETTKTLPLENRDLRWSGDEQVENAIKNAENIKSSRDLYLQMLLGVYSGRGPTGNNAHNVMFIHDKGHFGNENHFFVYDEGSTGGTWVNDEKIGVDWKAEEGFEELIRRTLQDEEVAHYAIRPTVYNGIRKQDLDPSSFNVFRTNDTQYMMGVLRKAMNVGLKRIEDGDKITIAKNDMGNLFEYEFKR